MVNGKEGQLGPYWGTMVGGKGSDGKFYFLRITNDGSVLTTSVESAQRTPAISMATGNGSVAAGKKSVLLIFGSTFTGTVLGTAFVSTDDQLAFVAPPGDTLAAIDYTVTAGTIRIVTIT